MCTLPCRFGGVAYVKNRYGGPFRANRKRRNRRMSSIANQAGVLCRSSPALVVHALPLWSWHQPLDVVAFQERFAVGEI
jgi:hypothetical protein